MSEKMKVWTCKFPADSDLNERLKKASRQVNLPYYKLLTKMLDLWDKCQAEDSLQSDSLNARINKIEKVTEFIVNNLHLKWDSEAEQWVMSDEQSEAKLPPS